MQFSTDVPNYDDEFNTVTLKAVQGDLLILGSDGLFDNMHTGFMTMLTNSLVAFSLVPASTFEENYGFIEYYVKIYKEILAKKEWVIKEFYAHSNLYSIFDENNRSEKPNGGTGTYSLFRNFYYKFLKDAHEPLGPEVQNHFENFLLLKKRPKEQKRNWAEKMIDAAFMDFFRCPVLNMVAVPVKKNGRTVIMNDCLSDVIKKHFTFEKAELSQFFQFYDPAINSKFFVKIAKNFALIKTNFASPFYIHAWKDKVPYYLNKAGNGKDDDITVVAALIVSADFEPRIDFNTLIGNLDKEEIEWEKRFEKDGNHYLNYLFGIDQKSKPIKREQGETEIRQASVGSAQQNQEVIEERPTEMDLVESPHHIISTENKKKPEQDFTIQHHDDNFAEEDADFNFANLFDENLTVSERISKIENERQSFVEKQERSRISFNSIEEQHKDESRFEIAEIRKQDDEEKAEKESKDDKNDLNSSVISEEKII